MCFLFLKGGGGEVGSAKGLKGPLVSWEINPAVLTPHPRLPIDKKKSLAGEDKVYLRSIEVVGLSYADVECPACEAGRYAPDDGMGDCLECPPGRFQVWSAKQGGVQFASVWVRHYLFPFPGPCRVVG